CRTATRAGTASLAEGPILPRRRAAVERGLVREKVPKPGLGSVPRSVPPRPPRGARPPGPPPGAPPPPGPPCLGGRSNPVGPEAREGDRLVSLRISTRPGTA